MNNLCTVSEAAVQIGVSADTIRRWDKKGLIKVNRSDLNYRLFDINEIKRLHRKIAGNHDSNNYKILKSRNKTKYTTIELFAGAGGTAIGFENAGLNHVLLNEWDKNAVETLKKNKPHWNVIGGDIAKVNFRGMKADIVQGGFPCQTFSYAGKKMGFEDVRGTMFFEFARCVKEVKPKIALGENVRGLLRHDNGRTLATMVKIMEDLGYRVEYRVVRSQYLDVPQKRERLIILAVRNDLKIPFKTVATDLETGEKVVIDKGKISNAIVASLSRPGTFVPFKFEDKILVDGGLVDPVPADVVREMGADIVIGVSLRNIQKDVPAKIDNVISITIRSIYIMLEELNEVSSSKADIIIKPQYRGPLSFDMSREEKIKLIQIGEEETKKIIPLLKKLIDSY